MSATDELRRLLDEFEHECFMIRVEASETRARPEVVRKAYERQRDETAQAVAATLGEQAALNKAAGNWAHVDNLLRGLLEECERCPDTGCTQYIEKIVKPNMRERAATLGSWECGMIPSFTSPTTLNDCQEFCCSVCGEYMVLQQFPCGIDDTPNYCPNCGMRVKR